jgi:riboflavin biosynthesis pyrimidine reductase
VIPYQDLVLPERQDGAFVYANFVQTIDGKTQVKTQPNQHWPIGSRADYQGLLELRARADVLIHGRKTAEWVRTIDHLGKPEFQKLRASYGKNRPILYAAVSAHPDESVRRYLVKPPAGVEAVLFTTRNATLPGDWESVQIVRLEPSLVKARSVTGWLVQNGYRSILVEGGPTLLRHFLDEDELDELFVTIAPKIYGGGSAETLSLIEGPLYPSGKVRLASLAGVFALGDELYVRYQLNKGADHAS